jgi:hypothetical protein
MLNGSGGKVAEREEMAELREKLVRAIQLLLFKHHQEPGAKAWELKKALGRDYEQVMQILDQELGKLGLEVRRVSDGTTDRYYIRLKRIAITETRTFGWRIDDLAMLTVALAHLLTKQGKAPLREVEQILKQKFPKWRVESTLDRFIRRGYLSADEEGQLYVGWRTRAEIDQRALLGLLLGKEQKG